MKFINRSGDTFSETQVSQYLALAVGSTALVLGHLRVGGIYENGTIWFQRVA